MIATEFCPLTGDGAVRASCPRASSKPYGALSTQPPQPPSTTSATRASCGTYRGGRRAARCQWCPGRRPGCRTSCSPQTANRFILQQVRVACVSIRPCLAPGKARIQQTHYDSGTGGFLERRTRSITQYRTPPRALSTSMGLPPARELLSPVQPAHHAAAGREDGFVHHWRAAEGVHLSGTTHGKRRGRG